MSSLYSGCQLARAMLRIFDPTVSTEREPETEVKLAPLYRNAKVVGGVLPGEFIVLSLSFSFFKFVLGKI